MSGEIPGSKKFSHPLGAGEPDAPRMSQRELLEHFRAAHDFLDEKFAYWVTHTMGLGKPILSEAIETACVALPTEETPSEDFAYLFSPSFAARLSVPELAFVISHETMHVLLDHLRLAKKFDDKMLANLAMDLVINDFLDNAGMPRLEGILRGESLLGFDCSNSTVSELYDLLREQQRKGTGAFAPGAPLEGMQPGENPVFIPGMVDEHSWIHQGDEKSAQQADQLAEAAEQAPGGIPQELEEIKNDQRSPVTHYGSGEAGLQRFTEQAGVSLRWAELLRKLNPDAFPRGGPPLRYSFRAPRRKLLYFYPETLLPVQTPNPRRREREQPSVVMGLDTSSSISREDADRFVTLARSIPRESIHLFACTFTTQYRELDLDNPSYASGGTDFSAVERYVRERVIEQLRQATYPKAVVVVTDGHAWFSSARPEEEQMRGWYWLMTDQGRTPQDMKSSFGGEAEYLREYVAGI